MAREKKTSVKYRPNGFFALAMLERATIIMSFDVF